jgi:hypothetical protein
MKPDQRFLGLPKAFWANVRTISQHVGYTVRGIGHIKVPSLADIVSAFADIGLTTAHIANEKGLLTPLGQRLLAYFRYRADVLNDFVEPRLMDEHQARQCFEQMLGKRKGLCPIPMNKQKGNKRTPAFLTGMVNMLIHANSDGLPCDYDPRGLTTVTRNGEPLRTLARRVDGAFPHVVNPVAVWEIKEYYYTTTFGSRVADGVYETLLDGMELEELREHEAVDVKHYLIIDARYTWWDCGRSYLCRIIDMLHMGYVDEVLFGREVMERLPALVKEWVALVKARDSKRKS